MKGYLAVGFFYLMMVITWISNIIQLVFFTDGGFTVLVVLKIIGIFLAPLGMFLGFLGLFGI